MTLWSRIGLGCGPLGAMERTSAVRLVHHALDRGVTVFDTAPSYGASEAHLGAALRDRRERAIVVTKGGYGVPGIADWTPECIARGIDRALTVMGLDVLDGFLLHSCPRELLATGALLEPLLAARAAGKVRAIGYSGDGEALAWAANAGIFDVLECSLNLFDQAALAIASETKATVLAKRAVGSAPWSRTARPAELDRGIYWERMRAMFDREPSLELAVRFAAYAPGVTTALVGTTREAHLDEALAAAALGPTPEAGAIRARFRSEFCAVT